MPLRLFVAVWPPAHVTEALAEVPVGEGRRTPAERLHVTLRFLGAVAEERVEPLVDALATATSGLAEVLPVTARVGPVTGVFGRSVLHVAVSGLEGLAAGVAGATEGFGEVAAVGEEDRPFVGHLTLARSGGRRRGPDLRALRGLAVPAAARVPWPVQEVTLVRSSTGPGGLRYDVLERFLLR
jgi:2'-5' RNA ligase